MRSLIILNSEDLWTQACILWITHDLAFFCLTCRLHKSLYIFVTCRRHFLQSAQGLLSKHFEKLIQCDPRLYLLSQQPEIVLDDPYFESRSSVFEGLDEPNCQVFDHLKSDYVSTFSGFRDDNSSCAAQSSSSMSEILDPVGRVSEAMYRGSPSPSSGIIPCGTCISVDSEKYKFIYIN